MIDAPISDREFELFKKLVYKHSHINLTEKKRALVKNRFSKVMRKHGIATYKEYYNYVVENEDGDAVTEMINAISTNLTRFFRENQHFDFMLEVAIPEMLARKHKNGSHRIRLWSAGCSTGEEPYTLSIVMTAGIEKPAYWNMKILATDIDSNVLSHGRTGVYQKKQIETIPPIFKNKSVHKVGDRHSDSYEMNNNLKRMISFKKLNLMQAEYPFHGSFDFIFCRNVMIYFDRPTQEKLVNKFYSYLEPGGYLFIGHSESLTGLDHGFSYIKPTIYKK